MKKKQRRILALSVVLVVLVAVYLGMDAWNRKKEQTAEEEEKASVIHVTDTEAEEITGIKLNVTNGELEFIKEDGTWYYAPDRDFPLDQSYPEEIAAVVGNITADRQLEDGDTMEDYGLDEPVYTVEYTDSGGNTTEVYFGDQTGDWYYVTVGDIGVVYTVENTVIDGLDYSLDEVALLDDYPSIGSGNLVREVITQNGQTTTYDSEDEDQSEDIAAIAGGLGAVTLSEAADYSVEDEDLGDYGLDEASRITVEAVYTNDGEEEVLTLYIGGEDGNGDRYVMINDSQIVYLISDEICQNILNN